MTETTVSPGDPHAPGHWLDDPGHRAFLAADARAQLDLFRASVTPEGRIAALDRAGRPIPGAAQPLHAVTRLIHSYALAQMAGYDGGDVVAAGLAALQRDHRDRDHGGWVWSVRDGAVADGTKLAYGHVFVLLAAASAHMAGHGGARALLSEVAEVLEERFWDDDAGRLRDEFTRDWRPFSTYRGLNANMHGAEAMLAAYEATGDRLWLDQAGRILDFFVHRVAPRHHWRLPEHYDSEWRVDPEYEGDPMFRPAGTTPGHSLELGRLVLQHWDLAGRHGHAAPEAARALIDRALADAWAPGGGLVYTLRHDGTVDVADRYWWPVTEGIGAMAALVKLEAHPGDEAWYRRLWGVAARCFIDPGGGWIPEIDAGGRPAEAQFAGKPDIYHALQADLLPLAPGLSRAARGLAARAPLA